MSVIIEVKDLHKTYKTPFSRKLVHAVQGITFEVRKGEAFGFLGPNGAGKTTTIRMLMGLIKPTKGSATLFGLPVGERLATSKLGFLPEAPYFYDYLSVTELLDLAGRLFGMSSKDRRKKGEELIDLVGLRHAAKSPLKSYSKGMMQRAGIAQALINDPELVVFDEPMSGLDPIGRKEVRDIIQSLKSQGKTIFFCSHILADVESLAERVAIVAKGKVRKTGRLDELLASEKKHQRVEVRCENEEKSKDLAQKLTDQKGEVHGAKVVFQLDDTQDLVGLIKHATDEGATLTSVTKQNRDLESVFMEVVGGVS